jgi:hypothetical protein
MSCDPIGIKGSRNLYVYSHNNPVRFADINGNEPSEQNSQPSGRVSFQAGVQFDVVTEGDKTELHEYSTEAGVYWTPTGSNVPALRLNQDKNAWEPIDTDVSIYEYQQAKPGFGQRLANRITGGVGLIFSGFEAYAGGVIIAGSEGLATVPGWALVVDASDKGAANARQLITGEVEHSLLYKGVKKVTGSDTAAFIVDNATPIVIAGIAAARPSRPSTPVRPVPKSLPPVKEVAPGAFGSEDVALGITKQGLSEFAGEALPGTRLPANRNPDVESFAEAIVRDAGERIAQTGGRIRFSLKGGVLEAALNPASSFFKNITSGEFRAVMRNPGLRAQTTFYEASGEAISGEDLFKKLTAQQQAVISNPKYIGPGPGGY